MSSSSLSVDIVDSKEESEQLLKTAVEASFFETENRAVVEGINQLNHDNAGDVLRAVFGRAITIEARASNVALRRTQLATLDDYLKSCDSLCNFLRSALQGFLSTFQSNELSASVPPVNPQKTIFGPIYRVL